MRRASDTLVDGLIGHLRNDFQVRILEANYVDFHSSGYRVADKARRQVPSCVSVFPRSNIITSTYIWIKRAV